MDDKKTTMHYGANKKIFEYSRTLRENMTQSEKVFWNYVSNKQLLGLKFRRQHPIGNYIADFYCHKKKLVIELDGKYHNDPIQQQNDKNRDDEMTELGIKVIRFTNEDVLYNIEKVIEQVKNTLTTIV